MEKAERIKELNRKAAKKLRRLLKKAVLIKSDREYVESLIILVEKDKKYDEEFISALKLILNQDNIVRKKCEQRMKAASVDIFKEILAGFSNKEIRNITKNMGAIQMNDGCSVGCPWCGLMARGYISKKISFESFQEFISLYGDCFRKKIAFMWASDPFDWYEGKRSYVDLAKTLFKKKGTILSTTTALPKGTELTVLRFLEFIAKEFPVDSREAPRLSVSYDNIFFKSVYKRRKLNLEDFFEFYLLAKKLEGMKFFFRFSVTKENQARIKALETILTKRGVKKEFIKYILFAERDILGGEKIVKAGRCFGRKGEDRPKNLVGIGCFDGVLLTPNRLIGLTMGVTTKNNPTGLEEKVIRPGEHEVPNFIHIRDYQKFSTDKTDSIKAKLLPSASYRVYRNGALIKTYCLNDIKRDILVYSLFWNKIIPLFESFLKSLPPESILLQNKKLILSKIKRQILAKEKETRETIQRMKIKGEMIEIFEELIFNIKKWLTQTSRSFEI